MQAMEVNIKRRPEFHNTIRNSYHNAQSGSITKIMAKLMEYKNHLKEVTPHQRPSILIVSKWKHITDPRPS